MAEQTHMGPRSVIVTGSSGLIGGAVCEALAATGCRVFGFDRPGVPHPPPHADNVACDVTSDDSVADALRHVRDASGGALTSVVHLAAYYDFAGEPSPLYDQVTVRGTSRLLAQLQAFDVEQFVFSSTMLVHAPCAIGEHIDEDWPLEPKWDYPTSKLETEGLIAAERGAIPAVILRIAGVYTDRCDSIPLANQAQRIYERRLTASVFPGDTSTGQSFVHLDDLVEAFRKIVERRSALPQEVVALIGETDPMSYEDLQRSFAELIHGETDWETTRIPKAVAKAGAWVQDTIPGLEEPFIKPWMVDLADDHYALNTARARGYFAWVPTRSLDQTLPKMVAALKADPARWYREHKLEGTPPSDRARTATRHR